MHAYVCVCACVPQVVSPDGAASDESDRRKFLRHYDNQRECMEEEGHASETVNTPPQNGHAEMSDM